MVIYRKKEYSVLIALNQGIRKGTYASYLLAQNKTSNPIPHQKNKKTK